MQSLFILENTGRIVVERHWDVHVPRAEISEWFDGLSGESGSVSRSKGNGRIFVKITRGTLNPVTMVCCVKQDTSAVLMSCLLEAVHGMIDNYLEGASISKIERNYVTVYQLIDEMIDGGLPCTTEENVLKDMILTPSLLNRFWQSLTGSVASAKERLPVGTLSNIPWRRAGVSYTNNSFRVDVIDRVHAIIDGETGRQIRCDVSGELRVKCELSGEPDLSVRLNNPGIIQAAGLHPCVILAEYMKTQNLRFVPPDREFVLLQYRSSQRGHSSSSVRIPLRVETRFRYGEASSGTGGVIGSSSMSKGSGSENEVVNGSCKVTVRAAHGVENLNDVVLKIALPPGTTNSLSPTTGSGSFNPESNVYTWKIGSIKNSTASVTSAAEPPTLTGSLHYSGQAPGRNPPIHVSFKAPSFSASGLSIDRIEAHNVKYKYFKGRRNVTVSGDFVIR